MSASVGSVSVEVVPDTSRFATRVRTDLANLPAIDIEVRADTAAAEAALAALARQRQSVIEIALNDAAARAGLDELGRARTTRVAVQFDDGLAAATIRAKIDAALKDLPKIDLNVSATAAEQKIKDLKLELATIRDTRIGVDVDAGPALARLAEIAAEIKALGAESASVGVRVDTLAASAKLAEIKVEVDRLDGRRPEIEVRIRGASEALPAVGLLLGAIALLGPALAPILAVASAGIVAIGAGAVGAAVGVGVLALAFQGVAGALTAMSAVRKNAGADAIAYAAAQVAAEKAVRTAVEGVTKARETLAAATANYANAQASANSQAIASAQAVANAETASVDAVRTATSSISAALRQEVAAHLAVQDAATAAGLAVSNALQAQVVAERALAASQKSSRDAQEALTDARAAAAQQLQDLAAANANAALSERQGQFALQDAAANLRNTLADPFASGETKAKAQLAFDQATQHLKDLQTAQQRAADAKAEGDKLGVEGSDKVQTALQAVLTATTSLADAQRAAALAATAASKAQVDGARSVAAAVQAAALADASTVEARRAGAESIRKAEQSVTAALAAQADQARNTALALVGGQRSITDAQRSLVDAQRAVGEALTKQETAAKATSASVTALSTALANLSPAGRTFVEFIDAKLRPAFKGLVTAAQGGLLPGLQAGLASLLPLMPGATAFVGRLAGVIGDLFKRGLEAVSSPFWRQFFGYVGQLSGSVMTGAFSVIGNLSRAFASLLQAFAPFSSQLGGGLVSLTARFAAFTAGLSTNAGFQRFLAYVRTEGPRVAAVIGDIVGAIIHIGAALAPLGVIVLAVVDGLAKFIKAIPTPILTAIAVAIAAIVIAVYALNIAMGILAISAALAGIGINIAFFPLIAIIALVALAIGVVVVVIIQIVKHFDAIKDAGAAVLRFFRDNWPTILATLLGPFGLAVLYITRHWDSIKSGANSVVQFIGKAFGYLPEFFSGLWRGIVDGFKGALNFIIRGLNSLHISLPSVDTHIPGIGTIGGFNIGVPQIPYLAEGGIVNRATLAVIGEAGPEAVVPLSKMSVPGFAASLGLGGTAPAAGGNTEVRVFIGDTELTHIVRSQVIRHDADAARQLSYGRRV